MTVYSLRSPASHILDRSFKEAVVLREAGRFDEARDVLQHILMMRPDHAEARLALVSFLKEDWSNGWEQYEWRLKTHDLMPKPPEDDRGQAMVESIQRKRWHRGPVPMDLLVFTEQGLGDLIHFSRFLPTLVRAGGRVTLVCEDRMVTLMKTLPTVPQFHSKSQTIRIGPHTRWVPLMSLARALDVVLPHQFTPDMPYLKADPVRAARWADRLGPSGFRIGLCWQGNPDPSIDKGRSMPLADFAPLAEIPDVRLISLQKGAGEEQIGAVPFSARIERFDLDEDADAFFETAAMMLHLDLVISVCTSTAHLAGALGRPQFILLKKHGADWRWLHQRSDSVWYPHARLFRQQVAEDWSSLMPQLVDAVRTMPSRRGACAA